ARVDCDQCLLHEILDIFLCTVHPAPVERMQQRHERAQQRSVGPGVAAEALRHQRLEPVLARRHPYPRSTSAASVRPPARGPRGGGTVTVPATRVAAATLRPCIRWGPPSPPAPYPDQPNRLLPVSQRSSKLGPPGIRLRSPSRSNRLSSSWDLMSRERMASSTVPMLCASFGLPSKRSGFSSVIS